MSAYVNDPRVAAQPDGTFDITGTDVTGHVCPGMFGGFVTHSVGVDDTDGPGFGTADEAIHSLIGDPR